MNGKTIAHSSGGQSLVSAVYSRDDRAEKAGCCGLHPAHWRACHSVKDQREGKRLWWKVAVLRRCLSCRTSICPTAHHELWCWTRFLAQIPDTDKHIIPHQQRTAAQSFVTQPTVLACRGDCRVSGPKAAGSNTVFSTRQSEWSTHCLYIVNSWLYFTYFSSVRGGFVLVMGFFYLFFCNFSYAVWHTCTVWLTNKVDFDLDCREGPQAGADRMSVSGRM